MARLDQLPLELISVIMDNVTSRRDLYACNLVNHAFHFATTPMLWRRRTIRDGQYRNFITSLRHQHHPTHLFGCHIRRLDFNLHRLTDKQLMDVMKHVGPQLEALTILYGRLITNTSFQHIPRHYPRLTLLHLQHSSITVDPWIEQLGRHCQQLQRLILTDCRSMDGSIFGFLAQCPLRYVLLNKSETGYLHKHGDGTQHLRLMSSYGVHPERFIMDVLTTAPHLWPHLTHLTIQGSCGPDEHLTIIPFLQTHVHLIELKLQRSAITDATLDTIGTVLARVVTRVNVSWNPQLTAQGIRRLVWRCQRLLGLSFDACGMTAADFPDLVAADRRRPRFRPPTLQQQQQQQERQQLQWRLQLEMMLLFNNDDGDDDGGDDDDSDNNNNNDHHHRHHFIINNNINNNEIVDVQPNFTGLGRLKILTIRQHSNQAGDYRQ